MTPSRRTEYHYALHQTTVLDTTAEGTTTLRFDYDPLGRLLAEHNHGGDYRYEYDALGNRIAEYLPGEQTLRHLYYGSGHLLQTHLDSDCGREVIAEYERDVLHREIRRTQGTLNQYRAYNICGHLTRQSCGRNRPELATPLLDIRYHRDARDNLLRVSGRYHPGLPERDRDTGALQEDAFRYNERGQIVQHEQDGHGRTFSYDAAMNGLGDSGYRQSPGLPDAPGNVLTACKEYRYRWDGFGRLAQRDNVSTGVKQRLHYDDSHRLIKVELLNDREWSKVEFSYDALDRRTDKRVWRHNTMLPVCTFFEWSGMRLCGERNDKVPLAHTLYLYEEGSWQPLARVDSYRGGSAPQQRVLYYHSLPNGFAPCRLTNSEGEIVWRGRMQLWGTLRTEENRESYSMHPAHNLRFAGQYLDRETGLHYNTFRYYAPESGRFTQLDPISIRGGLNLYAYAPNPLSWIDPLGLTGEWVNPKDINFSQRTISPHDYADIMRNGGWDWDRSPLRVIDIDGQLVSYDNRRLDAAREAGLDKVKVIRVDPNAPHPDSSTGKTWLQKFRERFRDRRNIKAGGIVPDKGLNSRPERTSRGCK